MAIQTASFWKTWLPLIISLGVNIYLVGFKLGTLEAAIAELKKHATDKEVHMPLTEKLDVFVPRREYESRIDMRDMQISEIRVLLLDQAKKIDRIYERLSEK